MSNLDPAVKKAYEISYALFRLAEILPSKSFPDILEKEALALLDAVSGKDMEVAGLCLTKSHYLISFGKDTGNINYEDADLLIRQISILASFIGKKSAPRLNSAKLDHLFSLDELGKIEDGKRKNISKASDSNPKNIGDIGYEKDISPSETKENASMQNRQVLILEKIRQSGNCRVRDIREVLPDMSERTLRYDLQRLLTEGKIERSGSGPSSLYRLSQKSFE